MVYKPPLRASSYHFLILFEKVMTLKHLLIFQLIVVYAQAAVFLHPGYSWVSLKKACFFKINTLLVNETFIFANY